MASNWKAERNEHKLEKALGWGLAFPNPGAFWALCCVAWDCARSMFWYSLLNGLVCVYMCLCMWVCVCRGWVEGGSGIHLLYAWQDILVWAFFLKNYHLGFSITPPKRINEWLFSKELSFGASDQALLHPCDTGCGLIFNLSTGSTFFLGRVNGLIKLLLLENDFFSKLPSLLLRNQITRIKEKIQTLYTSWLPTANLVEGDECVLVD